MTMIMIMGIVTVSIVDVDWVDYEFSLSIVDIVDWVDHHEFSFAFLWHLSVFFKNLGGFPPV